MGSAAPSLPISASFAWITSTYSYFTLVRGSERKTELHALALYNKEGWEPTQGLEWKGCIRYKVCRIEEWLKAKHVHPVCRTKKLGTWPWNVHNFYSHDVNKWIPAEDIFLLKNIPIWKIIHYGLKTFRWLEANTLWIF